MSENQGIHPNSELLVTDWEGIWQEGRETLQRAQERQRNCHDQKRQPAPDYVTSEDVLHGHGKIADRKMLDRKNICTKRPIEKLDHCMFGPFVVKRKISSRAYELELPARWTLHPVFHLGLLEPYREDPIGRPVKDIPESEIVEDQPSYFISEVVDSRWYGSVKSKFPNWFVQYLVAWEGYGPEENSWDSYKMVEGTATKVLSDFHNRYPSKPRDHRVKDEPSRGNKR